MRSLLAILCCLSALLLCAQPDSSLTQDFKKLSAKERTRIAREEEQQAAQDTRFQAVMAEAEDLFRQARYEASLDKYKEARSLRPYNVYPKVKIQDLQALIARMAAEEEQSRVPEEAPPAPAPVVEHPPAPPAPVVPTLVTPVPKPEVPATRPAPAPQEKPGSVAPAPAPVERPRPRVEEERRPVAAPQPGPADGEEYERILREGRAVVVERGVLREGRPVVFRKVTHPWGEVVHFRDGIAIPARVWNEEFGE